jgi:carbonic anhydrase/acetyltransferase-like protein (isoleucine patch superfamily)
MRTLTATVAALALFGAASMISASAHTNDGTIAAGATVASTSVKVAEMASEEKKPAKKAKSKAKKAPAKKTEEEKKG